METSLPVGGQVELSARWAFVNDQSPVTRADGPGYWNGWPVGPESQRVATLLFLLFCNPLNFTTILRLKILHGIALTRERIRELRIQSIRAEVF